MAARAASAAAAAYFGRIWEESISAPILSTDVLRARLRSPGSAPGCPWRGATGAIDAAAAHPWSPTAAAGCRDLPETRQDRGPRWQRAVKAGDCIGVLMLIHPAAIRHAARCTGCSATAGRGIYTTRTCYDIQLGREGLALIWSPLLCSAGRVAAPMGTGSTVDSSPWGACMPTSV